MNKNFKKLMLLSVVIISIFMMLSMRSKIELYKKLSIEKDSLQQQLTSLEKEIQTLNKEIALINTEEYMEKMAREKLGYIKSNEVVFRQKN